MCQNRQAPQVRLRMLFLEGGRRWMMEWRTVSDTVMAGFKTLTVPKTNKSSVCRSGEERERGCYSQPWGGVNLVLPVNKLTNGGKWKAERKKSRESKWRTVFGERIQWKKQREESWRKKDERSTRKRKPKRKTKNKTKKSGRLGGGVGWGPDLLTTPIGRKGRKGSQKGNCLEQTFEDDGRTCWCRGAYSRRSRDASRGEMRSPRIHFLLKGIFGGLNLASFLPSLPTCLHISFNVLYEHIPTDKNTGLVFYI